LTPSEFQLPFLYAIGYHDELSTYILIVDAIIYGYLWAVSSVDTEDFLIISLNISPRQNTLKKVNALPN
jgi:hypothetical protein